MKVAESFSRSLFWDVNPEHLDWKEHAHFIITRTLSRGGTSEVKIIFSKYTEKKIIEAILKSRGTLPRKIAHYLSELLNIPYSSIDVAPEYY